MITITFTCCGETKTATGAETQLVCRCGRSVIETIVAPQPRFTGTVTGPHAQYQNLPAVPVTLGDPADG